MFHRNRQLAQRRMRLMLPDERRARIAELAREQGASLACLSRIIGRNGSYISDYISRKVPYDLAANDRGRIARFLGVDADTLRPVPARPPRMRR